MKRDYVSGNADNVKYFTGNEVEHTPAYGMYTLFVTGVQPVIHIEEMLLQYCLLYTSPSPRDQRGSRMAASA